MQIESAVTLDKLRAASLTTKYKGHGMLEQYPNDLTIAYVSGHERRHLNTYRAEALARGGTTRNERITYDIKFINGKPVAVGGEASAEIVVEQNNEPSTLEEYAGRKGGAPAIIPNQGNSVSGSIQDPGSEDKAGLQAITSETSEFIDLQNKLYDKIAELREKRNQTIETAGTDVPGLVETEETEDANVFKVEYPPELVMADQIRLKQEIQRLQAILVQLRLAPDTQMTGQLIDSLA